ncbi:hypothetical protein AND4_16494 [Vibrio sp. AND4]|nr:hypothetical protein AND4_16494 [Vibrio sp. AND4]
MQHPQLLVTAPLSIFEFSYPVIGIINNLSKRPHD